MDKDEHSRVIGSGLCLFILGILDQYSGLGIDVGWYDLGEIAHQK
jgi:hypothetical protein